MLHPSLRRTKIWTPPWIGVHQGRKIAALGRASAPSESCAHLSSIEAFRAAPTAGTGYFQIEIFAMRSRNVVWWIRYRAPSKKDRFNRRPSASKTLFKNNPRVGLPLCRRLFRGSGRPMRKSREKPFSCQ